MSGCCRWESEKFYRQTAPAHPVGHREPRTQWPGTQPRGLDQSIVDQLFAEPDLAFGLHMVGDDDLVLAREFVDADQRRRRASRARFLPPLRALPPAAVSRRVRGSRSPARTSFPARRGCAPAGPCPDTRSALPRRASDCPSAPSRTLDNWPARDRSPCAAVRDVRTKRAETIDGGHLSARSAARPRDAQGDVPDAGSCGGFGCSRAIASASTTRPSRSAKARWTPSSSNPNFRYSAQRRHVVAVDTVSSMAQCAEPVVRQIDHRLHQASADAAPCQSSRTPMPRVPRACAACVLVPCRPAMSDDVVAGERDADVVAADPPARAARPSRHRQRVLQGFRCRADQKARNPSASSATRVGSTPSRLTAALPPTPSRWPAQRAGRSDRCRRPSPCRRGRHPCHRPAERRS